MSATNQRLEITVPRLADVVGCGLALGCGVMAVPQLWREHRRNPAHANRCDNAIQSRWSLYTTECTIDVGETEVIDEWLKEIWSVLSEIVQPFPHLVHQGCHRTA